jgi:hypothetical protein
MSQLQIEMTNPYRNDQFEVEVFNDLSGREILSVCLYRRINDAREIVDIINSLDAVQGLHALLGEVLKAEERKSRA